jgi:hypothetical protein
MQVEHSERMAWVAPTAAVVASDIENAQPEVRADGIYGFRQPVGEKPASRTVAAEQKSKVRFADFSSRR